jgi:hypothetical protein
VFFALHHLLLLTSELTHNENRLTGREGTTREEREKLSGGEKIKS